MEQNTNIMEEIAFEDHQIICALTNEVKTNKGKEPTLQSLILMLNEGDGGVTDVDFEEVK